MKSVNQQPEKLSACKACGYEGELTVIGNGFWLEVKCPGCSRKVEAFTPAGIIEAWGKEPG